MTISFGSNPTTFNSYVFSDNTGSTAYNQNCCALDTITGPGRVTDLNVFWDGDGGAVSGRNMLWNGNSGAIEIQGSTYSTNTGSRSSGGQHLHSTQHDFFFNVTHTVTIGFFRDKAQSHVFSINTTGANGFAMTTGSNAPEALSTVTFTVAYGVSGQPRMYGSYIQSNVYVFRGGVWTRIKVAVDRSNSQIPVKVAVFRGGAWTPLNKIGPEWDDEIEKRALIEWPDGSWEYGIIRDEEKVLFGVAA